jgi:NADH dehydrogenase (ubiquinone) Fe-S protein 6
MLSIGSLRRAPARILTLASRSYSTHVKEVTANDPASAKPAPNVSKSNELPTTSTGAHDTALVEDAAEATKMREAQAPNRQGIWSRSQKPREQAMVGPRFEQMVMKDQVR